MCCVAVLKVIQSTNIFTVVIQVNWQTNSWKESL